MKRPFLGVMRLARGRVDGLAHFDATPQAFLTSLAPLIAFSLVIALVLGRDAGFGGTLSLLLFLVLVQLAPPVLSHAMARYWDREDWWLRYATAYNWVQCALPLAGLPLAVAVALAVRMGLPPASAVNFGLLGLLGYMLWLQWLLARHGLDLSRGRAAVVVVAVHVGTYALAAGPMRVIGWFAGQGT